MKTRSASSDFRVIIKVGTLNHFLSETFILEEGNIRPVWKRLWSLMKPSFYRIDSTAKSCFDNRAREKRILKPLGKMIYWINIGFLCCFPPEVEVKNIFRLLARAREQEVWQRTSRYVIMKPPKIPRLKGGLLHKSRKSGISWGFERLFGKREAFIEINRKLKLSYKLMI